MGNAIFLIFKLPMTETQALDKAMAAAVIKAHWESPCLRIFGDGQHGQNTAF